MVTSRLPTCSVSWPGPCPRTSAEGEYTRRNSYGSLNVCPSAKDSSSSRERSWKTMLVGIKATARKARKEPILPPTTPLDDVRARLVRHDVHVADAGEHVAVLRFLAVQLDLQAQ